MSDTHPSPSRSPFTLQSQSAHARNLRQAGNTARSAAWFRQSDGKPPPPQLCIARGITPLSPLPRAPVSLMTDSNWSQPRATGTF
ncbi:hypothetical protein NMD1_02553 [Novosphingobium sp. MD-1]|nr:hypothetical protein NMD1_02553 [Novosphingobium sp. MD-1]